MSGAATADQLRALLDQIERLRAELLERRGHTPYPWDPAPLETYSQLLAQARVLLPDPPLDLPELPTEPPSGQALWRTPTDEALEALESLQAAVNTAIKAATD
jgi:hypothetical protein